MDNASKALIIAGAVLIAVMLVSVGVLVYNAAVGSVSGGLVQVKGTEVELFNSAYETYFGENRSTAEAQSLINKVNAFNRTSSDRTISLEGTGQKASNNKYSLQTSTKNANYNISDTDWDTNGYITKIKIDIQSKGSTTTGGTTTGGTTTGGN